MLKISQKPRLVAHAYLLELDPRLIFLGKVFDEGAKITGQIVDAHKDTVKIGTRVEPVFRVIQRDDPEGLIHYGFKFRVTV